MSQLAVEFSPEAQTQLLDLKEYLSERFYPERSGTFVGRLVEACISLGKTPQIGVRKDHLRPGMRSISFEKRATIYYTVLEDRVAILAIYYGGREFVPSEDAGTN